MKCATISLAVAAIGAICLAVAIIMLINLRRKKSNNKEKIESRPGPGLRSWHGLGGEDDPGLGWVL